MSQATYTWRMGWEGTDIQDIYTQTHKGPHTLRDKYTDIHTQRDTHTGNRVGLHRQTHVQTHRDRHTRGTHIHTHRDTQTHTYIKGHTY